MSNQENSPNEPASSGVIAPDWEAFENQYGHVFEGQEGASKMAKYMFYVGYCSAYNRLIQSMRVEPEVLALITAVMADELNQFFTQHKSH